MKKTKTKKLVMIAMLSAMSYILTLTIHFPLLPQAPFIKYTPSDLPIAIGGMIFGVPAVISITFAMALIEFITIGSTGIIGLLMNVISSLAFNLPIALICKKTKTNKRIILALAASVISMTVIMAGTNVLLTPLYTKATVEAVIGMLLPVIIPVNLLKSIINSILIFVIYKAIHKFVEKRKYDQD